MLGPEVSKELLDRTESVRVDYEQVTRTLAVLIDQTGLVQDFQVTRDSLRGDAEMPRDVIHRAGVARD